MSLPRDILDQLLSGYMDDALSGEERARVEQLLRDDAEVARELEELGEIRTTLRHIHRTDQDIQLQANFADRVLKSAVDQAATEGLGEQHPVMLLAQQPSAPVSPPTVLPWGKIAGAVVAVAASVFVAISVFRSPHDEPEERAIAAIPQPPDNPRVDPVPDISTSEFPGDAGIKVADIDPGKTDPGKSDPGKTDPKKPDITPPDFETNIKIVQTPEVAPKDPVADPNLTLPRITEADAEALLRGLVLVVNVREEKPGTVSGLMEDASLKRADKIQINEDVVGFKRDLSGFDGDDVQVFYIGASAKKIDSFIGELYVSEGIESVGLFVDFDRPIVQFAKQLRKLDPTTVRQEVSWELQDDSGDAVRNLVDKLSGRRFMTKPAAAAMVSKKEDGNDFLSQLLVLIRPAPKQ